MIRHQSQFQKNWSTYLEGIWAIMLPVKWHQNHQALRTGLKRVELLSLDSYVKKAYTNHY